MGRRTGRGDQHREPGEGDGADGRNEPLALPKPPVVVAPPLPKAKVYIVLGGLALKRWFPGLPGAPNQWTRTAEGQDVLVSNSPEYILRFKTVTPAVQKIKRDMWTAIKSVLQRTGG